LPYDAAGNINMTGGRRGKQEIFEGLSVVYLGEKLGQAFCKLSDRYDTNDYMRTWEGGFRNGFTDY